MWLFALSDASQEAGHELLLLLKSHEVVEFSSASPVSIPGLGFGLSLLVFKL